MAARTSTTKAKQAAAEAAAAEETGLAAADVAEAAQEAKRSFSLRDRIKGFKGSTKTHLIFFDLDAADAAAAKQGVVTQAKRLQEAVVNGLIENGKADDEGTPFEEDDKALVRTYESAVERAEQEFEEAYALATVDALQFTMRYVPESEVKHIDKEAKKAVGLAYNEKVEDDKAEAYGLEHTLIALSRCVIEIKDAEGNIGEAMTVEDARALHDDPNVPSSVWRTLLVSVNTLIYSNQFAKLATDNPGF